MRLQITTYFPKILPTFSIFFGSLRNLLTSCHSYGYSCKIFWCERPGDFMFTCLSHQAIYKFFGKIIALSCPKRMVRCKAITLYKPLLSSYLSIPYFPSKINQFSHKFSRATQPLHYNHPACRQSIQIGRTKPAYSPHPTPMPSFYHSKIRKALKFQRLSPLPGNHCEL